MSDVKPQWKSYKLVLASDYDALAQRCRQLEAERDDLVGMVRAARLERDTRARACLGAMNERDTLRAEVVAYQAALADERGRHATAEMALRAEVERLQSEMEDLMFALSDAEHRAENAGRNASAFEDRMGDLQVENGKLRAEVERLREIREIASQCAANGGYLNSQDLIELRELLGATK